MINLKPPEIKQTGNKIVTDKNGIKTIDIDPAKMMLIPPPEALFKKSAFVPEQAQTGAAIAFIKL